MCHLAKPSQSTLRFLGSLGNYFLGHCHLPWSCQSGTVREAMGNRSEVDLGPKFQNAKMLTELGLLNWVDCCSLNSAVLDVSVFVLETKR